MGLENIQKKLLQGRRLVGDEEIVEINRLQDGDSLVGEAGEVHLVTHHVLGLGEEVGGPSVAGVRRSH